MHTYHSLHAYRLQPRGCSIYTNLYVHGCLSELTHPIHALYEPLKFIPEKPPPFPLVALIVVAADEAKLGKAG